MGNAHKATSAADFSREALTKAKWERILFNPFTLWATPVGIAGLAGFAVLDPTLITPAILLMIGGAGLTTGLGALLLNLARGQSLERAYTEMLRKKMEEARREKRERLVEELVSLGERVKGMSKRSAQCVEQMDLVKQKKDALERLLSEKLSTSELTYLRLLGTAEQLYLSVLDNAKRITGFMVSIESVASGALRDEQVAHIDGFLSENASALELLDRTNASAAAMETSQGREASLDPEMAMSEMRSLIERIHASN